MYISAERKRQVIAATIALAAYIRLSTPRQIQRKYWVRPLLLTRKADGEFFTLVRDMRAFDHESFLQSFRMLPQRFDHLLGLISPSPRVSKCTRYREPISAAERLCVTLRYLSTGDAMGTIALSYRLGRRTVATIIKETCMAICDALGPLYLRLPDKDNWAIIAKHFEDLWNFPGCPGAIDGKHVNIECPPNSGSEYHNYKGIVLLAVCDAHCRFTYVDIGSAGRQNDAGIFASSKFGKMVKSGSLDLPDPEVPRGYNKKIPFAFVGDEAFPLLRNLMRPFPGCSLSTDARRIFNYRLSRARRTIENAFGILTQRFRIFKRPIAADMETVLLIVKASCVLHNYLKTEDNANYMRVRSEGNESGALSDLEGILEDMNLDCADSLSATDVRERYIHYFSSDVGRVEWQLKTIHRGL